MNLHNIAWRSLPVVAALSLQACFTTYSAKPITATVADAETGEPLEGVNIVAHWVLHNPYPSLGRAGDLELLETVTDKDGKFHFPGWEGKSIPSDRPSGTALGNGDPALVFFKSGYRVRNIVNEMQPDRLNPKNYIWARYSDWDGKVITLEKFRGNLEFYASGIDTGIGSGVECPWKKIPKFYVALMKERQRLDRLGVRSVLPTIDLLELNFRNARCGSAKDFFGEYM